MCFLRNSLLSINKFWSFWVYFSVFTHWENKSPIEKIFLRFWILSDHVTYINNELYHHFKKKQIFKKQVMETMMIIIMINFVTFWTRFASLLSKNITLHKNLIYSSFKFTILPTLLYTYLVTKTSNINLINL